MRKLRSLLLRFEYATGGYFSPVVTCLFAVNLAVFLASWFTMGPGSSTVAEWLMLSRSSLLDFQLWRLVTAGFTQIEPGHLLMNLLVLGFFGHNVEQHFGARGFLTLVLGTIVISGLAHVMVTEVPYIGFSGAAYAILVAFATLAPRARLVFFIVFMPAWLLVTILISIDVLMALGPRQSDTAHLIHLVGAGIGFLSIRYGHRWWRLRRRLQAASEARRVASEQRADADLDRLLAKVSEHGLPSLTAAERRFLQRYSRSHRDR
ncbi:MAG: rhomboid family intramembrane serine protease [Planctomycetota bacterium]